jgi:hypothetical protein
MRKYKWRDDLPNDIISGLTVGIMQLPQGILFLSFKFLEKKNDINYITNRLLQLSDIYEHQNNNMTFRYAPAT